MPFVRSVRVDEDRARYEQVCSDPDDDKFLACALASGADCVVSGDKAHQRVSGYRNIRVVAPHTLVDTLL